MRRTITISESEYLEHRENYDGLCLACGEWSAGGCEPDARGYECEACGKQRVFGAEELMLMGVLDISGDG